MIPAVLEGVHSATGLAVDNAARTLWVLDDARVSIFSLDDVP